MCVVYQLDCQLLEYLRDSLASGQIDAGKKQPGTDGALLARAVRTVVFEYFFQRVLHLHLLH
jgi:hypothetical protein